MKILNKIREMLEKANLGVPFTIYNGKGMKKLDSSNPHIFITLANIPENELPGDSSNYSWIDFGFDPEKRMVHSPYISLTGEHKGRGIAKKLNKIMEDLGINQGCKSIRAYNIVNEKLVKIMPRLGYILSGIDDRGPYLEKKLGETK